MLDVCEQKIYWKRDNQKKWWISQVWLSPHILQSDLDLKVYTYRGKQNGIIFQNKNHKYWIPSYDYMDLEFDEIYPVDTLDISLDDTNMLIDLE